jgi:hypothetical protein
MTLARRAKNRGQMGKLPELLRKPQRWRSKEMKKPQYGQPNRPLG